MTSVCMPHIDSTCLDTGVDPGWARQANLGWAQQIVWPADRAVDCIPQVAWQAYAEHLGREELVFRQTPGCQ